jgi:hypothetical protein
LTHLCVAAGPFSFVLMPITRATNGSFAAGTPVKAYRMRRAGGRLHLAHRLRAENALGKPLPTTAVVHHADGTKDEHAPLVICQDETYHRLLHARTRIVRAGGNPNTERICSTCKRVLPIEAFAPAAAAGNSWYCKGCPERARRNKRAA